VANRECPLLGTAAVPFTPILGRTTEGTLFAANRACLRRIAGEPSRAPSPANWMRRC